MAEKKAKKKSDESKVVVWEITKSNGNVIKRNDLTADYVKNYEDKGWKVKKVGE